MRFLILLCAVCLLTSCGKTPAELIIGKWKIDDLTAPKPNVPDSLMDYYQIQLEKQNQDMISTGFYEFQKEGKSYFELLAKRYNGKYRLSEDGTKLYFKDEKSPVETEFTVEKLDQNELIISMGEGKDFVRMAMKRNLSN